MDTSNAEIIGKMTMTELNTTETKQAFSDWKEPLQLDQWDEATRGKKMSSSTGRVIYKYQMPVLERFIMQLPAGAQIIRMADQGGMFWLWAVVDTNVPDETRTFHAVKCGGKMPDIENLVYVGCCAVFVQMELMLYIFEEVKNA